MSRRRVVLIEFNELCPTLLDRWIDEGLLPNFKRFRNGSNTFVTMADEVEAPNLEPWIQWYSLHTGLSYDQHGVFHLTNGPNAGHEDIWQYLARRGFRVGNFGSMNAGPHGASSGFYVADPWCAEQPSIPSDLQVFQSFVAKNVREYTNQNKLNNIVEALSFAFFMTRHGLKLQTLLQFAERLVAERTYDKDSQWKRATLLDLLQSDVFFNLLKRSDYDFVTFFSNSTAHFQHAYWRHMDPVPFLIKPSEEELARYGGAILYGYQQMDRLLERFFALEGRGYTLILASALSQQPFVRGDESGGQRFYRPKDVHSLLEKLNIRPDSIEPTMTNQFMLRCAPSDISRIRAALLGVKYDGVPIFGITEAADEGIYFGCSLRQIVPADAILTFGDGSQVIDFYDNFYLIDGLKSGRHHPDGVFWLKTNSYRRNEGRVSILDVFPTLVELVAGSASGYEIAEDGNGRTGRSLLTNIQGSDVAAAAE